MSKKMKLALKALQTAIDKELERKAKLGYNAVVADEDDNPIVVPARELLAQN